MPDISSCYFCSSLEGNTEYPLIPERLDPSGEAQRTVVVCETCREKLDQVFEPLTQYIQTDERRQRPPDESTEETQVEQSQPERAETPSKSQKSDKVKFSKETRKIVRLLQNRELPANRDEIELLASNAYEIDRSKCQEILDSLIEHEYFVETNGELRLPDE